MSLQRESFGQKAWRKTKENPLIPVGLVATVGAFLMAGVRMKQGRSRAMNNWLWLRVAAQAFTITVASGSLYLAGVREQAKKADREAAERQAAIAKAEFEERLRLAEEQYAEESGVQGRVAAVRNWWGSSR